MFNLAPVDTPFLGYFNLGAVSPQKPFNEKRKPAPSSLNLSTIAFSLRSSTASKSENPEENLNHSSEPDYLYGSILYY